MYIIADLLKAVMHNVYLCSWSLSIQNSTWLHQFFT